MAGAYTSGKRALGVCDICGFTYKLKVLKNMYVKDRDTHIKACRTCWNPSHPQLRLGEHPVRDPQALRDPRPDTAQLSASRAIITPIISTRIGAASVGTVTVMAT